MLANSLPANCRRNVYILAIGENDPVTVTDVLDISRSCQVPHAPTEATLWIFKRNNRPRADLEEQRSIVNQVRVVPVKIQVLPDPVACPQSLP
jgi:hypothetical protein